MENQTLQTFLNEKFEQISELANINLMQLDKEVLAKKMLGCIDMINEVLKSNISMREQVKNYAIALDQQKTNFMRVKLENEWIWGSPDK